VTTNPHRPNYFKPDFFNGIGATWPLAPVPAKDRNLT